MDYYKRALELHEKYRGKIDIKCDMPLNNREDLAVAYTPGVAQPCLEIAKDPANAYKYTSKSHLVAIVTDGSAVLGLGNIGGMAKRPRTHPRREPHPQGCRRCSRGSWCLQAWFCADQAPLCRGK